MARAAKKIFQDDAIGRLQMITFLHDFDNIDKHIKLSEVRSSLNTNVE